MKNKMKKAFTLFVASLLCVCMLVACSDATPSVPDNYGSEETNSTEKSTDNETSGGEEAVNEMFHGTIEDATVFSKEGYAFVCEDDFGKAPIYCINKKGEIQFCDSSIIDAFTTFVNGKALIYKKNVDSSSLVIMDTDGNVVVSPETHGYDPQKRSYYGGLINMFYDGYFLVYRDVKTFEGTTREYGVIDTDGNWKLPYSSSYWEDYNIFIHSTGYENGYFWVQKTAVEKYWWNLEDGSITEEPPTDIASGNRALWETWNDYSYRDLNGEIMVSMRDKYPTISQLGPFSNGMEYTYALFSSNTFFTLIDRKGEMLFEPYELGQYAASGGIFIDYRAELFFVPREGNKIIDVYGFDGLKKEEIVLPEIITSKSNFRLSTCSGFLDGSGYMIYIYVSGPFGTSFYTYFVDTAGNLLF